jgi:photosystem II stability/assembly factor-like uncharacterized protein
MRARSIFPLLLSGCFVLLLAAFLLAGAGGAPTPAFAGSLVWSDLHGPAGGPAQALALNPNYPADPTVLAGGGRPSGIDTMAGFGLFRSLDGGLTWADPGGLSNGALMDAAFSPAWQSDGFALAGFWQGVWSTTDGGDTWQMLSHIPSAPSHISAVAVASPAAGKHTLLAGGPYGGVYQSADEGATWTWNGDPGTIHRLRFHPALPDIALAAGYGLWRSTDAGLQWTRVTTMTTVYDVAFADDGSAFAVFDNAVWRSDDDGATWQQLGSALSKPLQHLGVSGDGAALFAATDTQLYRYDATAGELVAVPVQPAPGYILRLAPSPVFADDQTLLIGTNDGVWRSTDGGQTFVRSAGFVDLQVYALAAADNSLASDLYAGTEFGVWRRSGGKWESLNPGFEGGGTPVVRSLALSPAFAQDQTIFVSGGSEVGLGSSVYRSTNRGRTWQSMTTVEYTNQIVVSPAFAQDRRVYLVAVQGISTSDNGGETWTRQPFWDFGHSARVLAISPNFAQDQTLIAGGSAVYRSTDAGATWSPVAGLPPIDPNRTGYWSTGRLHWSRSGAIYLTLSANETTAPYTSHYQLWVSTDQGQNWSQVTAAPDLPLMGLATGPSMLGSGEAIYLSTFDDKEADERQIASDLYVSRDRGATWLNLGATPGGAARLLAAADVPDRLWAGSRGAWLLEAASMPTATPNLTTELLRNRSFEDQEVWRIPTTAYPAAYSQEQRLAGYWSMRTGIVEPAGNVRSYSDFSQDVTLPLSTTITLRLHRWPSSGSSAAQAAAPAAPAALAATTLDEFYRLLETAENDLQYVLLIRQPGNKIVYLYTGLDNRQAWVEQTFDLSAYGGQAVRLQFGTFNNGSGALAAQYFDVLEVQAVAPLTHSWWLPVILKEAGGTLPPAQ